MKRYIIRRFIFGIIVVGIVSLMIFLATRIGPDPAFMIASPGADEAELNSIRDRFGLNEPLPVQYFIFIKKHYRPTLVSRSITVYPFRRSCGNGCQLL